MAQDALVGVVAPLERGDVATQPTVAAGIGFFWAPHRLFFLRKNRALHKARVGLDVQLPSKLLGSNYMAASQETATSFVQPGVLLSASLVC